MNLKVNAILFLVLLIAFLFGEKSFHIAYHTDYFVFKLNQIIICLLTTITGLVLIFKFLKRSRESKV